MAGGVKIIDQAVKTTGDLDVGGAIKAPRINWAAHTDYTAGSDTLTIAEVLTGILEADSAAQITWTLPTAALAVAGVANVSIGDCIDFSVINTSTAGTEEEITVAMGTGGTALGNMVVPGGDTTHDADKSGSGLFRIRFTGVASGSEAYLCYRIA